MPPVLVTIQWCFVTEIRWQIAIESFGDKHPFVTKFKPFIAEIFGDKTGKDNYYGN